MDADRLARLELLAERQDILDCLIRFCRGMDRFDRELFLSAFHDDAEIAAGPFAGGPVELYDWASAMHEHAQSGTHHDLLNHTCSIEGGTAHTETYYLFVASNRDGTTLLAGGRYLDRFEKRGGAWRIAFRNNLFEWSAMPPTVPLPFSDVPDIFGNGAPTRGKDDPSYLRPLVNRRKHHVPGGDLQ